MTCTLYSIQQTTTNHGCLIFRHRWNAESIHQDQWPDPEQPALGQSSTHQAPAPSSNRHAHSSHYQQSPAYDQQAASGYDQEYLRPEANTYRNGPVADHAGHAVGHAGVHAGHSNHSQYAHKQLQQPQQQPYDVYIDAQNQYGAGYADQHGYLDGQPSAGLDQEANNGFIQSAPFELYSDPIISSMPFELYPDKGPDATDPYSTQEPAGYRGQGFQKPYYQQPSRPGFHKAVGSAPSHARASQPYQQKQQPDPLAFLTGQTNGLNSMAPRQQDRHVTQPIQQSQEQPYGASGWDVNDVPEDSVGHHNQQQQDRLPAADDYQAPIREVQRQRQSQRPSKVCLHGLSHLLEVCICLLPFLPRYVVCLTDCQVECLRSVSCII